MAMTAAGLEAARKVRFNVIGSALAGLMPEAPSLPSLAALNEM
jgi:hypothetical protein